jgi:hypothetical protein
VIGTSPEGFSSTWIGVQTNAPGGPFIQLGTYADESVSLSSSGSSKSSQFYGIFWSDTARAFRPVGLVELSRPGDLISFDMTQNDEGWYLKVHNLTVGWSRSIQVNYAAANRFTQADWLQEDPADGEETTTDMPYALTSTVDFQHLEVNHRAPRLRYEDAAVLAATNNVILVPTRPQDDGFSLRAPSGDAAQLLRDAASYDAAIAPVNLAYEEDVERPGSAPLPSVGSMTNPMTTFADVLSAQSWPSADQGAVQTFVVEVRRNIQSLQRWARTTDRSWATLSPIARNPTYVRDTVRLKAVFGLPPSVP